MQSMGKGEKQKNIEASPTVKQNVVLLNYRTVVKHDENTGKHEFSWETMTHWNMGKLHSN